VTKEQEKNRKKWVKALRSGKYKQGRSHLRREDRFCCLGVACDLHAKETGGQWVEISGTWSYAEESGILPREVRDWLGFDDGRGLIGDDLCLAASNDDGASFEEIAQMIETYPEELSGARAK
jgi:hypothetical protein